MRALKVNRFWPALAVALGAALVIVTAASADSGKTTFVAYGIATSGDTGQVDAAGKSGRYVVKDRTIVGALVDPYTGAFNGSFSFTFGTNVPIATQSGQIHGDGALNLVTGIDPSTGSPLVRTIATSVTATATNTGECTLPIVDNPYTSADDSLVAYLNYLRLIWQGSLIEQLDVAGGFTFTNGDQGHGDVSATVCFVRDYVLGTGAEGHIAAFAAGSISLVGEWSPS